MVRTGIDALAGRHARRVRDAVSMAPGLHRMTSNDRIDRFGRLDRRV
jgi:hypothetical protein